MVVTNGRIIVEIENDETYLQEVLDSMKQRATDVLAIDLDAELVTDDEERKYPFIRLNTDIEYHNIQKLCEPDIELQYRAIGNEIIQLPENYVRDFEYHFNEVEKAEIASKMAEKISEKESLEEEKKAVVKDFGSKIQSIEKDISYNGQLYREGYKVNTYNCQLHLDFENKKRVWTDNETKQIVHTEDLKTEDYSKMIFGDNELEKTPVEEKEPGTDIFEDTEEKTPVETTDENKEENSEANDTDPFADAE